MVEIKKIYYGFFVVMAFSSGAFSGEIELPQIYGKPYHKAREELVNRGWQPAQTVSSESINEGLGQAKDFFNSGYVEINDCAPTGSSPCIAYFKSQYGKFLKVVTMGESGFRGDDFPVVDSAEIIESIPEYKYLAGENNIPDQDRYKKIPQQEVSIYSELCEDVSEWYLKAGRARANSISKEEWQAYKRDVIEGWIVRGIDMRTLSTYVSFMSHADVYAYHYFKDATPRELKEMGRKICLDNNGELPPISELFK